MSQHVFFSKIVRLPGKTQEGSRSLPFCHAVSMMLHHASLHSSVAGADRRVLRCRGRASCVRPVGFLKEAAAHATQSTEIAAKKAATKNKMRVNKNQHTKVVVFSSGKIPSGARWGGGAERCGVGELGTTVLMWSLPLFVWLLMPFQLHMYASFWRSP